MTYPSKMSSKWSFLLECHHFLYLATKGTGPGKSCQAPPTLKLSCTSQNITKRPSNSPWIFLTSRTSIRHHGEPQSQSWSVSQYLHRHIFCLVAAFWHWPWPSGSMKGFCISIPSTSGLKPMQGKNENFGKPEANFLMGKIWVSAVDEVICHDFGEWL